jgi:hypothetical protein
MSLSSGGSDLDIVLAGGDAFLRRVSDYQASAALYKKALDDLNLGKSAQAAMDEVMTAQTFAEWKADAEAKTKAALDTANAKHAEADAKLVAANAPNDKAQKIIADAQIKRKKADAQMAETLALQTRMLTAREYLNKLFERVR